MNVHRDRIITFLRDAIWQFISVVVGIFGLLLAAFALQDVTLRVICVILVFILTIAIIAFVGIILPEKQPTVDKIQSLSSNSTISSILSSTPSDISSSQTTPTPPASRGPITSIAQQASKNLFAEGEDLYHHRRYKAALTKYKQAEALNPNDFFTYQRLGDCYYKLHDHNQALNSYNQANLIHNYNTLNFYHKAMTLENLNRGGEAMAAYRQGTRVFDPNDYSKKEVQHIRFIQMYYRTKSVLPFFAFFAFFSAMITGGILGQNASNVAGNTISLIIFIPIALLIVVASLFVLLSKLFLKIKIDTESDTNKQKPTKRSS